MSGIKIEDVRAQLRQLDAGREARRLIVDLCAEVERLRVLLGDAVTNQPGRREASLRLMAFVWCQRHYDQASFPEIEGRIKQHSSWIGIGKRVRVTQANLRMISSRAERYLSGDSPVSRVLNEKIGEFRKHVAAACS